MSGQVIVKKQQHRTEHPRTCPPWEEWRRFSHGLVEEVEVHQLTAHLGSCNRCLALVRSLSEESDTLIGLLQSAEADYSQEPEFQEVADRLASEHRLELSQWLPKVEAARWQRVNVPADVPNPLDDYLLTEVLGRGSMGCVYKAQHRRLKKVVAVKVLVPKYGQASDLVDRFDREMEAVGSLNHPNIVAATDAGEDQGHSYLVMEYVDGLDLQTILHRLGPLSVADACEVMRQACLGLEAAHQQGLVHRDIKPSNLLLSVEGVVKVLDLGLVTLAADDSGGERRTSPVGTASYMAPEQWLGRAVDIGADLYSAGCTLFKLLTGRAPFEHCQSVATCRQSHCEEPPPDVTELLPEAPTSLASVIETALAKAREKRFTTPAEFAEALEPFIAGADLSPLVSRARKAALDDTQPGVRDQTLPGTLPHAPPPRGLWRRLGRARLLTAVLLVSGLTTFAARTVLDRAPSWRPLGSQQASVYWSASTFRPEVETIRVVGRAGLRVKATELSLISLGVAADDTYAIQSTFDPTFENPVGLFLGAEQTSTLLNFYTVEVREIPQEQPGTRYRVALRHHRLQAAPPAPPRYDHPVLAYDECILPQDTTTVRLEVRVSDAFLDVLLADHLMIHAPWAELSAGHNLPQAGHYGLFTHFGEASFLSNSVLDLKE